MIAVQNKILFKNTNWIKFTKCNQIPCTYESKCRNLIKQKKKKGIQLASKWIMTSINAFLNFPLSCACKFYYSLYKQRKRMHCRCQNKICNISVISVFFFQLILPCQSQAPCILWKFKLFFLIVFNKSDSHG